jgi:predicted phage-related endonuclease
LTTPRPADRADWLELRRDYFNASAAAVLWERHPYQSAADYAVSKIAGTEQDETSAMRRGTFMEESVAQWWAHEQGVTVYEPDELYVADPIMATVDRFVVQTERPVEIKTAKGHHDEPMDYWLDQCQAIMLCCGSDVIELVWVDGSLELHHQTVDADEAFQREMLERARNFIADVDQGIVPDWIEPTLRAEHIIDLYPSPAGEVEVDRDTVNAVLRYADLRTEKALIEGEMKALRDEVVATLGDHEAGVWAGEPIVTFKAVKGRRRFDDKAFAANHPELAEQYMVTGKGSRRFMTRVDLLEL